MQFIKTFEQYSILEGYISDINSSSFITDKFVAEYLIRDNVIEMLLPEYLNENPDIDIDDVDESEIIKSKDFFLWMKEYLIEQFESIHYEISSYIKDNGTIDLWRCMTVPSNWLDKIKKEGKHLGIFWACKEEKAEAHWGAYSAEHVTVVIKISISEKSINWHDTLYVGMDLITGFHEEAEIRLFKNTPLNIEEITIDGKEIDLNEISDKKFVS